MIYALDHVAIAVQDIEAAAKAYEALLGRAAGMRSHAGGATRIWFQLSNMALELIAPTGPGAAGDRVRRQLAAAGDGLWIVAFATDDLIATQRTLERRGVPNRLATGSEEGALIADAEATHGVTIVVVERTGVGARQSSPPLGDEAAALTALDHVVIHTPNPDRAMALYGARLGLDLRLDRTNAEWGSRLLFFRCAGVTIEISHSLETGASDGPDRLGGLAWRTADPAAARARIADAGLDVSDVRKGRKPGTEVFTVRSGVPGAPSLVISAAPAEARA
jgi:catechol 2,3-dioxygenase-like lactoylglutathione lyase family enzyme